MKNAEQVSVIYETSRLKFRGLSKNDIEENYFHWFNDQEICKYNSHGLFPNTIKKMESFIDLLSDSDKILVWAMIDKKSETHIGNISLQEIDWLNRSAEFAIILGEENFWNKGFATEASEVLLQHGFNKLNLHRIYCGTAATNIGMKKLAEKLGMKQEGIRRNALFLDGFYVDLVEYGILCDEFSTSA